jgi:hypothetical protein
VGQYGFFNWKNLKKITQKPGWSRRKVSKDEKTTKLVVLPV